MRTTIKKILNSLVTQDLGFMVFYTDDEGVSHNYSVYTNDQFRQIAKQLFGGRVYDDWEDDSDEGDAAIDFYSSYSVWRTSRQETYGRRMYALSVKFNPLENYNSHEYTKHEFEHGEKVDLSFDGRKDTTTDDTYTDHTFTDYKETTKDDTYTDHTYTQFKEQNDVGQRTTTRNVSADDAQGFVPNDQTIESGATDSKTTTGSYRDQRGGTNGIEKTTTGSYKDQRGFTNGLINEKTGTETTEHSGKDTEEITQDRAGNIGVTTSQQMLASDLDLLRYDITMMAIREFVQLYTFISSEVD